MIELEHLYELVSVIGNEGATRSSLSFCQQGYFIDKLDSYVDVGILEIQQAKDPRDDVFFLDSIGRKFWRHELSIKDVEEAIRK